MTTRKTFSRFAAFALALLVVWPAPSRAYRMLYSTSSTNANRVVCDNTNGFAHWNQATISWYHKTSGQGSGKAGALQAAMATWTNASQSDHVLNYVTTTTNGLDLTDNQNTFVWGDTSSLCTGNACHAITVMSVYSGQEIDEVDIVFNELMDWRTDGLAGDCASTAAGNSMDTQAIATHELGHSLGIHHPNSTDSTYLDATMGGSSCNVAGRSLHSDDLAALQCLNNRYPVNPNFGGYLDVANCRTISGWAWNSDRPSDPVYLDLKRGSTLVDILLADQYRADLVGAGIGNGYHGFSLATPSSYRNGQWQTVRVQYPGTGVELGGSPKSIMCNLYLFPNSWDPDTVLDTGGTVYEVGTQLSTTAAGYITHLGFYWAFGETGSHTATLWTDSGTSLGSVSLSAPGLGYGWTYGQLSTAVQIQPGVNYRVSVNTNTKQSKSPCSSSSSTSLYNPYTNSPLVAHQGFWKAGTGFPNTSSCSNYFVSVRFDT